MKDIEKYFEDGGNIRKLNTGGYRIFTIPTQHFNVKSLSELTPEKFDEMIIEEKVHQKLIDKMFRS